MSKDLINTIAGANPTGEKKAAAFNLSESTRKAIEAKAQELGINKSELVDRLLDQALKD